jgi:hypothetical protein
MRRLLGVALSALFLLPLAVVTVLVGFAVGWWVVAAGLALFALAAVPMRVSVERMRARIAQDVPIHGEREALNRELRRQDQQNIRSMKRWAIWGSVVVVVLTVLLVAVDELV